MVLPVIPEERHMSSLLWETICRPHVSPTCRLDSHLSSATGSLEPSSSCFCDGVYRSLDGVKSGPAFPDSELIFQKTVPPDEESLKSL